MSLVPRTVADRIQYYETQLPAWANVAEAIGSTPEEIAAVQDITADAREAYAQQQAAQAAAQAATIRLRNALAKMQTLGSAVIVRARVKAQTSGDPAVYSMARIPVPEKGSPLAEPGTPSGFKVQLQQDGTLELGWTCENPAGSSGTIYEIFRSDAGPGGRFAYIGNTGAKKFTDARIPAGASQVTYKLQAVRSTKVGACAFFNVNFGGVGVGGAVVPNAPRLAA
jgi:hypothetical protein